LRLSVSLDAANFLLKRDVSALGIDTLSPDRPTDGFKVHQAFLGNRKILIENVAHLENMPPMGAFVVKLKIYFKANQLHAKTSHRVYAFFYFSKPQKIVPG